MSRRAYVLAAVVALLLAAPLLSAVQQPAPETRIITVTTLKVPFTEITEFYEVVDKYVIPQIKANPHILSSRMATHAWGSTAQTVWLIQEFKNLGAIDQSNEWGNADFEKRYPEGTAQRDSADKAFEEHFNAYFNDHTDNLLVVNVNRMK